jgi:hypothetical protein
MSYLLITYGQYVCTSCALLDRLSPGDRLNPHEDQWAWCFEFIECRSIRCLGASESVRSLWAPTPSSLLRFRPMALIGIRGLSSGTTAQDIFQEFLRFGTVTWACVTVDPFFGTSRGGGFVVMPFEGARNASVELQGCDLYGGKLTLELFEGGAYCVKCLRRAVGPSTSREIAAALPLTLSTERPRAGLCGSCRQKTLVWKIKGG